MNKARPVTHVATGSAKIEQVASNRRMDRDASGHVGIMRDASEMIHASGHDMLVVSEPLRVARDRILAKGAGPITSVKRLSF